MLMETLSRWIGGVNDVLWTYVLVAALLGCAVWFTLRTRGVQFRLLGEMMRVLGESAGHRHHGGCIQQPVGCSILHHYAGRLQNGGTEAGL